MVTSYSISRLHTRFQFLKPVTPFSDEFILSESIFFPEFSVSPLRQVVFLSSGRSLCVFPSSLDHKKFSPALCWIWCLPVSLSGTGGTSLLFFPNSDDFLSVVTSKYNIKLVSRSPVKTCCANCRCYCCLSSSCPSYSYFFIGEHLRPLKRASAKCLLSISNTPARQRRCPPRSTQVVPLHHPLGP